MVTPFTAEQEARIREIAADLIARVVADTGLQSINKQWGAVETALSGMHEQAEYHPSDEAISLRRVSYAASLSRLPDQVDFES